MTEALLLCSASPHSVFTPHAATAFKPVTWSLSMSAIRCAPSISGAVRLHPSKTQGLTSYRQLPQRDPCMHSMGFAPVPVGSDAQAEGSTVHKQTTHSRRSSGRWDDWTWSLTRCGPPADRRGLNSTHACRGSRPIFCTAAKSAERRADRSTRGLEHGSCARVSPPRDHSAVTARPSAISPIHRQGRRTAGHRRRVVCMRFGHSDHATLGTLSLDRIVNSDHLLMNLCRAEGPSQRETLRPNYSHESESKSERQCPTVGCIGLAGPCPCQPRHGRTDAQRDGRKRVFTACRHAKVANWGEERECVRARVRVCVRACVCPNRRVCSCVCGGQVGG